MITLNTAQNRLAVIMGLFFGYLALPMLFGAYLYYSLGRGYFPPEADAIAIPFAGFLFLWIVGFPVFVAVCFSIELVGRWITAISQIEN